MFSSAEPSATQIVLYFSEPLTASVASTVSNYAVSGRTVSAVALARDNTEVTLTLSSAMTLATAYTVTMTNLTTVSGDPLAATLTFTFTYETQGTGSILWRYYANIGSGTAVSNLTSAITYPNVPTTTAAETSFEAPHSTGNTNYGETLSGYVYPPTTGYYIFTIASDNSSQLWLSTNNSPAGLVEIAWVSTSTGYRQWSNASNPEQTSTSIYLTAGTPYYILALEKHGTDSGDNLSVRWEIPATTGGPASTWELNSSGVANPTIPIPGIRLAPPTTQLDTTTPPAPANLSATVTANNTQVTLAWSPVLGLPSGVAHYNIYRDGSLYATSTTTSYVDTSGISSKTRHSYQVTAINFDGLEGVKSATVTAAPAGIAAIMTPSTTSVLVQFTEPVDPTTATTLSRTTRSPATPPSRSAGPVLQSDGYTVKLTTSPLGTASHTLTVSNVKTLALSALPTNFLTTTFVYASPGWAVTAYKANITLNDTIAMAQTLISTPSEQSWVKTQVVPYIDFNVTGGVLHFPSKEQTLVGTTMGTETDNFAVTATGMLVISAAGTYTFGCDSDDGFSLTITGATFSSVTNATNSSGTNSLQYNGGRGVADTLGVVTFSSAGDYPISLLWFQGGGGSACELYAGSGSYTSFNSSMELVGDTADGGLSMGSTYIAPPFTVGINALSTNNTSPALTGTVTDPAASVSVRVNGSSYAATNNGDGTWSLPQGDISALAAGTYNVVATGVNASGVAAFNSTVNQLSINTTLPTATITAPTSPVNSVAIHFSEPVENFTLQDLQLTLATSGAPASEPLEGATLTTSDNQNWTLGNLANLTTVHGTYVLTLDGLESTITDLSGNPLVTNASTSWAVGPVVLSINPIGSTVTDASSVQYAVTFNESVTNVALADFTLASNGTTGTIASLSGSGSAYTVTVNNVSGNGTLGLNLVDNTSIVDQNNDPLVGNFTGQPFTIDAIPPTVSIGPPSAPFTNGTPVSYTVTYADANFNSSTLAAANVTLNETGTASGTIGVSGSGLTRTVTISNITGDGSLGISIVAGTASDLAGNLAPAAGPSTTFTVDTIAPTVATPASATGNPLVGGQVTGTTAALSVLGADSLEGEGSLTYSWAATAVPSGVGVPSFSINGSNAAKNTTVTFTAPGNYTFQVTITNLVGLTATSSVNVTVNQTLTSIGGLTPGSVTLSTQSQDQFTVTGLNQFGGAMAAPGVTWTAAQGTITSSGLYTPPAAAGSDTITAQLGSFQATASVTIVASAGWWKFNEGTGATAYDSSANGDNGTISNGTWLAPPNGVNGTSALGFNGSSSVVSLGNPTALQIFASDQITFSAWIKPASITTNQYIIDYKVNPTTTSDLMITSSGTYQVGFDGSSTFHGASVAIPSQDLNSWVHLAGTFDGQTWRLYRDGQLVASSADSTTSYQSVEYSTKLGYRGNDLSLKRRELFRRRHRRRADLQYGHQFQRYSRP